MTVLCRNMTVTLGVLTAMVCAVPVEIKAQGLRLETEAEYGAIPRLGKYRAFLPPAVDLSREFPKPGRQGLQGSCTAWAVGYGLRGYYEHKRTGWDQSRPEHLFSPAFLYNPLARGNCDAGATLAQALERLQNVGAVTLAEFPYDPKDCSRQPGAQELAEAANFRIHRYFRVDPKSLDDIKGRLVQGDPVVIGMDTTKNFDKLKAGEVYDPQEGEIDAGHAMVVSGYSDAIEAFKVFNSWGTDWGDDGYGWISYRAFRERVPRAYVMRAEQPDPSAIPSSIVLPVSQSSVPPIPSPVVPPLPVVTNNTTLPVVTNTVPPKPAPVILPAPEPKPKPVPKPKPLPKPTPPAAQPSIRSEVEELVRGLSCAEISTEVRSGGEVRLAGFLGTDADRQSLETALGAVSGLTRVNMEAVGVRPWPQCEALQTFKKPLGTANGLELRLASPALAAGSRLVLEVTTPSYPSYLYLTYLPTSGEAVHLYRPRGNLPKPLPPNTRMTLGAEGPGQPTWRIGPPFGPEMVVAVASASPLFSGERPQVETEREYLTAFRIALIGKSAAGHGGRKVAAATATLETRP
ncbi:MAG: C1 family peptidase [Alphaproteobacteria bacterium]